MLFDHAACFYTPKSRRFRNFITRVNKFCLQMASDDRMNQSVMRIVGKSMTYNDVMAIFRFSREGFPEQV